MTRPIFDHEPMPGPCCERQGQARQSSCSAGGAPALWRGSSDREAGALDQTDIVAAGTEAGCLLAGLPGGKVRHVSGAAAALALDAPETRGGAAPARAAGSPPVPGILVLDTCVLLSNVLRRVFLRLAGHGCFIPAWSEQIGGEWRRNASRIWGVPMADIEMQWTAMQQSFPMADQGDVGSYESGLQRSDPKDWHVIAAGRAAKGRHPGWTAAIVTRNTKDFNRTELRGYGLALFEPDDLLLRFHAAFPELMGTLILQVPQLAAAPDRELDSLEAVLKRERLFRLNRLYRSPS